MAHWLDAVTPYTQKDADEWGHWLRTNRRIGPEHRAYIASLFAQLVPEFVSDLRKLGYVVVHGVYGFGVASRETADNPKSECEYHGEVGEFQAGEGPLVQAGGAWDVNCGWCGDVTENVAARFLEKYSDQGFDYSLAWLDSLAKYEEFLGVPGVRLLPETSHLVLHIGGWWFDSQNPHGVQDWKEMQSARRLGREEHCKLLLPAIGGLRG